MRLVVAGKGSAYERITNTTECVAVPSGTPLRPGDVLLSVQYDRIVSRGELAGFSGAYNLHFGLLPDYRGCFPLKWAIINGDPVGVSLHYMVPEIDAGPVIDECSRPSDGLTDGEAYEWANHAAVLLWETWKPTILAGRRPPARRQNDAEASYYPRVLPFDGLRSNVPDHLLERTERAYTHPGYPGLQ